MGLEWFSQRKEGVPIEKGGILRRAGDEEPDVFAPEKSRHSKLRNEILRVLDERGITLIEAVGNEDVADILTTRIEGVGTNSKEVLSVVWELHREAKKALKDERAA